MASDAKVSSNFTEDYYANVYQHFIEHSTHVDIVTTVIKTQVWPLLRSTRSYLDIGAGPAHITKLLAPHFTRISIVEPNVEFYKALYEQHLERDVTLSQVPFQEFQSKDPFDFVLCSHMLYHLPQAEWESLLAKIHNLLEPHGIAVIILAAKRGGFHGLCQQLNPEYSNSEKVCQILNKLQIKYQVIPISTKFVSNEEKKFNYLVKLFALDDCFLPDQYEALPKQKKIKPMHL